MTARTHLIDMLHEFHTRPGVDVQQPPVPALVEGLEERESYLREEFSELQSALAQGDLVGYADALADMVYVIAGSAWRAGIDLDAVLAEVHRSNMTKTASPGDGKAIKGPSYSRPDVAGVLVRSSGGQLCRCGHSFSRHIYGRHETQCHDCDCYQTDGSELGPEPSEPDFDPAVG